MFHPKENDYNHIKLQVAIVLSGIAAVASLAGLFFGGSQVSESTVLNALSKMEALKAGGSENREKVQELYSSDEFKAQQAQAIDQALQKIGSAQGGTTTNTTETQQSNTLSQEQLESIKANAYIDGNKDSKFLIVEYTDPECPFCVRQYQEKTIKNVMAANKDVAHIVKVVQGVNHTNTEYKSLAAICAAQLKGEKAYYTMYDNIMGGTQGTFPSFTLVSNDQVVGFAKNLGISNDKLEDCMASTEAKSLYAAYRKEAQSLGASGTPGNIIINTESGKYVHLAGAYPLADFQNALTSLE